MMLIQFRLENQKKEVDKEIMKELLEYLKRPEFRKVLDSRDPSDISDAIMKRIVEKILNEDRDFQKNGKDYNFRDHVPKLARELRDDILLLSFTYEYIQEYPEDIELTYDPATDREALNDYITQFEGYLEADKITDVNKPSDTSIQTAFEDARAARALGIDELSLGDLIIERLQPVQPQETQVQTATYMPAGFASVLKGFGGVKRTGKKYNYSKLPAPRLSPR